MFCFVFVLFLKTHTFIFLQLLFSVLVLKLSSDFKKNYKLNKILADKKQKWRSGVKR